MSATAIGAPVTITYVPGRDLDLEAAKACLAAAFKRRLLELRPSIEQEPQQGRRAAGWQRDVAHDVGVSQFIISKLWQGKVADLRLSSLLRLQRWMGRPMDEVLGLARQYDGSRSTTPPASRRKPA